MSEGATALAAVGAAYLAGSIPFGLLMGRLVAGVDIRTRGSGNIGATNVARVVGARWGLLVLILDFAKGALPTWGLPLLVAEPDGLASVHLRVVCGIAAVVGHMFPCWLRFRGGKGVATGAGVVLVLSPWATLAAVAVFAAVFGLSRFVSAASMLAALAFGITELVLLWPTPFAADCWSLGLFSLLVPALIILRHRSNLVRLLKGQEPRMTFGQNREGPVAAESDDGRSEDRPASTAEPLGERVPNPETQARNGQTP
ncbi:MAG: glycerol-3-phosphate 1-O-acyltransferase PlsY [Planctomycetes bacterium]|nr:glycerol-3-phosphate 1-O-acyltransferase PlsY [Planctomycetota bacterium]